MKLSTDTEKKTAKIVRTGFDINKESMHLNIKVEKNGETIVNEKGNSLVFQFLAELATMFNAGTVPRDRSVPFNNSQVAFHHNGFYNHAPYVLKTVDGYGGNFATDSTRPHLFSITAWDGNKITMSHSANPVQQTEALLNADSVCIVGGSYSGNFKITNAVSLTSSSMEYTLDGFSVPTGTAVDADGVVVANKFMRLWDPPNTSHHYSNSQLQITNILVGNSTQPVKLHDVYLPGYLNSSIMEVTTGRPQVSTPTIAIDSSQISISQQFTNKSGSAQTVSEMGLFAQVNDADDYGSNTINKADNDFISNGSGMGMVARDQISPFQVANQESFTVTYEFRITALGKSGVVAGFNEMLYREFTDLDRAARNYFNNDWIAASADGSSDFYNDFDRGSQFHLYNIADLDTTDTSFFGLQVGTSEDDIDIDDYYLRNTLDQPTRIHCGSYDGSLWYHPTYITKVTATDTEGYIEFERLFENLGSTPVVIKEVGLTGGWSRNNPVLLARNVLETVDHITVNPGEIAKVIYRIGIATGV